MKPPYPSRRPEAPKAVPHPFRGAPKPEAVQPPAPVPARKPGEREPITLAQFLKVVQIAETGGHAKALVREGGVTVNGEREDRPGRKLTKGDVVAHGGQTFTVDR
jgi:ribosome-associated protein